MSTYKKILPVMISGVTLAASIPVNAQQADGAAGEIFNIDLYFDAEYTDNASKTEENEKSEVERSAGVNLRYLNTGKNLSFDADYSLSRVDYLHDRFSDETRLDGSGRVEAFTDTRQFSWMAQYQQDFRQVDNTATDTPGNRDQRATFITGPNALFRVSSVDTLSVSGRYIDTSFDDVDDNDSERTFFSANFVHLLSPSSSVGIDASYTDVEFDDPNSDYEVERIGLNYSTRLRRSGFNIAAGDTTVDRSIGDDVDGEYLNANAFFRTELNQINAYVDHAVTDSSIGLSLSGNAGGEGFDSGDGNFENSDIVTRTRAQLSYRRVLQLDKSNLTLSFVYDEEDYETLTQDQESYSGRIVYSHILTANLDGRLSFEHEQVDFTDAPGLGEDERSRVDLDLDHSVGERISLSYGLSFEWRDNDDDASREYEALIASAGITYRLR